MTPFPNFLHYKTELYTYFLNLQLLNRKKDAPQRGHDQSFHFKDADKPVDFPRRESQPHRQLIDRDLPAFAEQIEDLSFLFPYNARIVLLPERRPVCLQIGKQIIYGDQRNSTVPDQHIDTQTRDRVDVAGHSVNCPPLLIGQ